MCFGTFISLLPAIIFLKGDMTWFGLPNWCKRLGAILCMLSLPVWLKFIHGISFRTNNKPFKQAMQRFIRKIVQTMKDEKLLESQCGLIILSQIKNEYKAERKRYGHAGVAYMNWVAKMAAGMDTGVPWSCANKMIPPDPLINTCNGFYCDYFSPNKANKPTLWTEAWTGWFSVFGGPNYQRLVEDLAFAVARFIKKGGSCWSCGVQAAKFSPFSSIKILNSSFVNYYMYHGGTNFGRTSGGPFITTGYDYDAPIDEYALVGQPKHDYLLRLHKVIKFYEKALVNADPAFIALGKHKVAYVFNSESGGYAAFLSNFNRNSSMRVRFNNMHYDPSPWSISVLPDRKNVVFNSAQVGSKPSKVQMVPKNVTFNSWETFSENVSSVEDESTITAKGLLEQLSSTRDTTDYLWYTTRVDISSSESFPHGGKRPILTVKSEGPGMHVFINGELAGKLLNFQSFKSARLSFIILEHLYKAFVVNNVTGSAFGSRKRRRCTFRWNINLHAGTNQISILRVAMGLSNMGSHFERTENWSPRTSFSARTR
ncbi:hypothetical protein SLE2022_043400 [Rubroshorea leprosula]